MKPHKVALAVWVAACFFWVAVVAKVGVKRASLQPKEGVLSYTFVAWERLPISKHLLLGQYEPGQFEAGRAYNSYSYPFLVGQYAVLYPLRALGLPWSLAHNALPWLYMAVFAVVVFVVARPEPRGGFTFTDLLLLFSAAGVVVTSHLPWISLLRWNRDNFHLPVAIGFCALSARLAHGNPMGRSLWTAGVLIALVCPVYVPAWLLALLCLRDELPGARIVGPRAAGVTLFGALNFGLPSLICRMLDLRPVGSSYWFRSGLDGSPRYLESIPQAIFDPMGPRAWPLAVPLGITLLTLLAFAGRKHVDEHVSGPRVRRQAFFLAIPYASTAILFPQFTSIHPYLSDMLLVVPASFLMAFWMLQRDSRGSASGEMLAASVIAAGFAIMTNLLAIAQTFR